MAIAKPDQAPMAGPIMPTSRRFQNRPLVDINATDFVARRNMTPTPVYQQARGTAGTATLPGQSMGVATITGGSSAAASARSTQTDLTAPIQPDSAASPAAKPTSLTPQQQAALDAAISGAFSDINKGNTNSTLDWKITNYLQGTGLFSQDLIDTIGKGALAADPHGGDFWQKGNQAGHVASWTSNIQSALQSLFQSNTPKTITAPVPPHIGDPPPRTPQPKDENPPGTTPATPGTTTPPTDPYASTLGSILGGGGSAGSGSPGTSIDIPSPVVLPGSTQGNNKSPLVIVAVLGAAGVGVWWYMKHHTKGGKTPAEHVGHA